MEEKADEGAATAPRGTRKKPRGRQCRWATPNGSDGVLCCCRRRGHNLAVEGHATAYETDGALTPPPPGTDQRVWLSEKKWRERIADEGRAYLAGRGSR